MNNNIKKIIFFLVIIFTFIGMYILNSKTHLAADDYAYHFTFSRMPNEQTKRITNPIQIFPSMANHWKTWGGRVVVHSLLQFCFMIGIPFFNIINSIMFILLGYLIYKHVDSKVKYNYLLLIFIYSMIFLFAPTPATTLMWKSGSANYLWSTVLILCMSLIYKKHFDDEKNIKDSNKNMILIFLYGLITGCTMENTGCALIILELLYIIYYKKKHKHIPKWAISGLIGTIIGYTFLMIAPGNYVRKNTMYDQVTINIKYLIHSFSNLSFFTIMYLYEVILLIFISIIVNIIYTKKFKIKNYNNVFYLFFILVSIYSMILSPIMPKRCFFIAFCYFLIILTSKINYFNYTKKIHCLIIILSIITINKFYIEYIPLSRTYNLMEKEIREIKKKEERNYVIKYVSNENTGNYNIFSVFVLCEEDSKYWSNVWIAKYYNIDSIIMEDTK